MAAVTNIVLAGVELLVPGTYNVSTESYYSLKSAVGQTARLVDMAGRHPAYVGKQKAARDISLLVFLTANSGTQRAADYDALVAACTTDGLVSLLWTEGSTTRRYWCHVESIVPDEWMSRVAIELIAPDPAVEVV